MAIYQTGDTPGEIWNDIPSFPGYQLSSDMRVRSFFKRGDKVDLSRWRILNEQTAVRGGYPAYNLMKDGKGVLVGLHKIVALTAYGEIPQGACVLHGDDDVNNNFPSNLTFGSKSDNFHDSVRNKKMPLGEQRKNSKLSDNEVREIRQFLDSGMTGYRIAKNFNVSESTIYKIRDGKSRSYVT